MSLPLVCCLKGPHGRRFPNWTFLWPKQSSLLSRPRLPSSTIRIFIYCSNSLLIGRQITKQNKSCSVNNTVFQKISSPFLKVLWYIFSMKLEEISIPSDPGSGDSVGDLPAWSERTSHSPEGTGRCLPRALQTAVVQLCSGMRLCPSCWLSLYLSIKAGS